MKSIGTYLGILTLLTLWVGRVDAQYIDTVCAGEAGVRYYVKPNAGSTYVWKVDGGTIANSSANGSEIFVDWGPDGGYKKITLQEINAYGCKGIPSEALVWVKSTGKVDIFGPDAVCNGESATLQAKGADKYLWSTGETNDIVIVNPNHDTSYTVIGYFDDCGISTSLHDLRVRYKPVADFDYNPDKPVISTPIQFNYTGTNNVDSWRWNFEEQGGAKGNSSFISPQYVMQQAGILAVHLSVKNNYGCTDSITKYIVVDAGINVFVPTAFTPNGDELNGIFLPTYENVAAVELTIMNRWGEVVFKTNSLEEGWDGSYKGEATTDGVFVYYIQAKGYDNKNYTFRGTVTMVR